MKAIDTRQRRLSQQELVQLQRDYIDAIAPLQKHIANIYALSFPILLVSHDMQTIVRIDDGLTDAQREVVEKLRGYIQDIFEQFSERARTCQSNEMMN